MRKQEHQVSLTIRILTVDGKVPEMLHEFGQLSKTPGEKPLRGLPLHLYHHCSIVVP